MPFTGSPFGNIGGIGSGIDDDAIHDNVASEISAITEKVTPNSNDVLILEDSVAANVKKKVKIGNLPTGGGGEANTASNSGTGTSIVNTKTGIDLEFNGVKSENNRLSVALDGVSHDVELTVNEANIDHDNLTNTHNLTTDIDHDQLTNFETSEHIKWALTGAEDVHDDRITSSSVTQHEANIDHDNLTNTHNLTTDIDHDNLTNTHNLTTDIDHDQLTNFETSEHIKWALTGAEDVHDDRITSSSVTQHEADIDHDALTNTHNLTTDIDHDSLTNYAIAEHRIINDAGTSAIELFSASKIDTELGGKTDTGHTHTESDITDLDHDDTDAIHDNVAAEISAVTEKVTPVSGDFLLIEDSAAANVKKRIQVGNLPDNGGEANTASNSGTGTSIVNTKTGIDLEFNGVKSENNRLSVALDGVSHDVELTVNEANIDHDNLTNTHNLTIDIDHDNLTNNHNLTTDIDHDQLTNFETSEHIKWALTGAEDVHDDRITSSSVTQHEANIDHDALTNYDIVEHRIINDSGTSATELWSASKINGLSGTDDDAIHDNVASEISVVTEKVTPVSGDFLLIEDSAAANVKKRVLVGNLPTGGGGEANTASNSGAGTSIFNTKTGIDLEFNGVKSENNRLSVALDGVSHDVELTVNEANIDHDSLTNTHNLTTDIDHDNLTNTHNLTTDIDHDSLTNYAIAEHRIINDAGTSATELFSASKIDTDLGNKLENIVEDTTPQLGGDLDLNDKNISLTFPLTSDHTTSGLIIPVTVDVNATGIGAALYVASDGNYEEADADTDTTSPCTAIALEIGTGSKEVLLLGNFRDDTWNWTPGGMIFLSTTAGALTQTAPSGDGDQVQIIGYALNSDTIYFNPQLHVIEIEIP